MATATEQLQVFWPIILRVSILVVGCKRYMARYWMNPNQRVDGLDGILPNQAAVHPGMSNHHGGAVDRMQAI